MFRSDVLAIIFTTIIIDTIYQILPIKCDQVTVDENYDLFDCPDPPVINYIETNDTVTKYIDYRAGCSRQWVLKREGYISANKSDGHFLEVKKEAILILTHLDLDSAMGDYLLVADGIPNTMYSPEILAITENVLDESKIIAIHSPITWIGLVTAANDKSKIGLVFTWIPPELATIEEAVPVELRAASIDLCFMNIDCAVVAANQQYIKSGLTEMVNSYLYDRHETTIEPIDERQVKIIRNESRINDEKNSDYKYCRVQIAITSQVDINWAHPQLANAILSTIWFTADNISNQVISIPDSGANSSLIYQACLVETFDPFVSIRSIAIFLAGLAISIGLWRWHHSHILATKKAVKLKVDPVVMPSTETKHNPIYESENEDDEYVIG